MRPPTHVPRGRDYLRMLGNSWLIILCATLLSAGGALLGDHLRAPQYRASTQLFAVVAGDAGTRASRQGELGSVARLAGYGQLAKTRIVLARTIDDLHLDLTVAELAKATTVTVTPKSSVLRVEVVGHDADATSATVTALAKNLASVSRELETGTSGPVAELVVVDKVASAHRVTRSWVSTLAVGALLGFALSSLLVIARGAIGDAVLGRGQLDYVLAEDRSGFGDGVAEDAARRRPR